MEETRKQKMKRLRKAFNETCLKRDDEKCVICGKPAVDAHHITDRHLMPNDGYAKENGICLCSEHHVDAELKTKGMYPDKLYVMIGSSYEEAVSASEKL